MRAVGILVFCLFSSILSPVTSIDCDECFALEEDCDPFDTQVVTCEEDEFCFSFAVNTTIINLSMNIVFKECSGTVEGRFTNRSRTAQELLKNHWNDLFVTTTVGGRFLIARTNSCKTELCNREPLHLERYDELKPNGFWCPGCYALDEDYCKADEVVFCVGTADQCLTMTNTIKAFGNFTQKSSYKGCTTQSTCSIPLGISQLANGKIQFDITTLKCRKASSSEPDLDKSKLIKKMGKLEI